MLQTSLKQSYNLCVSSTLDEYGCLFLKKIGSNHLTWWIFIDVHMKTSFLWNPSKRKTHNESIYNLPEGKDYKWYISGIFPANWVIIYYRSHPLEEPEKSIERSPPFFPRNPWCSHPVGVSAEPRGTHVSKVSTRVRHPERHPSQKKR